MGAKESECGQEEKQQHKQPSRRLPDRFPPRLILFRFSRPADIKTQTVFGAYISCVSLPTRRPLLSACQPASQPSPPTEAYETNHLSVCLPACSVIPKCVVLRKAKKHRKYFHCLWAAVGLGSSRARGSDWKGSARNKKAKRRREKALKGKIRSSERIDTLVAQATHTLLRRRIKCGRETERAQPKMLRKPGGRTAVVGGGRWRSSLGATAKALRKRTFSGSGWKNGKKVETTTKRLEIYHKILIWVCHMTLLFIVV